MLIPDTTGERRRTGVMRSVGVLAVVALLTLVTAFDYQPSDLFRDRLSSSDTGAAAATRPGDSAALPRTAAEPVGTFAAPVDVIVRPGDPRLIVVELTGTITAADPEEETTDTVLDLSHITRVEGERGLLGAAFHPVDDLLYVHHSDLDGDSVIAEYEIDPDTGVADASSRRELLVVSQPHPNHNGGQVAFGPDGYLYLGFGDGGSAGDPDRKALDLSSPLGKILRIDPARTNTAAFTVPDDNPFVDTDGADPTIWSYGLRNPWKFSFDADTGDLWIADVGQNGWEEINFAAAADDEEEEEERGRGIDAGRGLSFGWSAYEGPARYNRDEAADGHVSPHYAYERTDGRCSISGGAVYRGDALPAWHGWYVYGDYCTGQIFAFDTAVDADDIEVIEVGQLDSLVAVASGPDGELYALSVAGPVVRLVG